MNNGQHRDRVDNLIKRHNLTLVSFSSSALRYGIGESKISCRTSAGISSLVSFMVCRQQSCIYRRQMTFSFVVCRAEQKAKRFRATAKFRREMHARDSTELSSARHDTPDNCMYCTRSGSNVNSQQTTTSSPQHSVLRFVECNAGTVPFVV